MTLRRKRRSHIKGAAASSLARLRTRASELAAALSLLGDPLFIPVLGGISAL